VSVKENQEIELAYQKYNRDKKQPRQKVDKLEVRCGVGWGSVHGALTPLCARAARLPADAAAAARRAAHPAHGVQRLLDLLQDQRAPAARARQAGAPAGGQPARRLRLPRRLRARAAAALGGRRQQCAFPPHLTPPPAHGSSLHCRPRSSQTVRRAELRGAAHGAQQRHPGQVLQAARPGGGPPGRPGLHQRPARLLRQRPPRRALQCECLSALSRAGSAGCLRLLQGALLRQGLRYRQPEAGVVRDRRLVGRREGLLRQLALFAHQGAWWRVQGAPPPNQGIVAFSCT